MDAVCKKRNAGNLNKRNWNEPMQEAVKQTQGYRGGVWAATFAGVLLCAPMQSVLAASADGVSATSIRVGGVMDLQGDAKGLGAGMKRGIEAAFSGEKIQGRSIEFVVMNDFYDPSHATKATKELVDQGVFAMLGNVGTPTAAATLPILDANDVPAVGFFTGAGLLRPGVGDVINYRASYVQETAKVIEAAISAGVNPKNICAFVQNDAYGMAGVTGIRKAFAKHPEMEKTNQLLDDILKKDGEVPSRNDIGPVGVYTRNTLSSRDGYVSLKNWEKKSGDSCKIVVTVGAYKPVASFVGYSRYKNERWVVSAVSFTGADNFSKDLKEYNITDGVLFTHIVPLLNSDLPIVREAMLALGENFGYVSLEGYIVGKMFINAMKKINGDITRDAFLKAVRGSVFDVSGITMDFSNDNQGSDLVVLTKLGKDGYSPLATTELKAMLPQ